MAHSWRAPACYVSVALVCMLYIWLMPHVGLTDLFAGAGIGAALMWALNDWELRHEARRQRDHQVHRQTASLLKSRLKAAVSAARGLEGTAPIAEAPPEGDGIRRLARAAGALEAHAETALATSSRHEANTPSKPETPIEAWRREVLTRDIERMEVQLRALATQQEDQPYGEVEHPRPGAPRRDAPDRWQRPARSSTR